MDDAFELLKTQKKLEQARRDLIVALGDMIWGRHHL